MRLCLISLPLLTGCSELGLANERLTQCFSLEIEKVDSDYQLIKVNKIKSIEDMEPDCYNIFSKFATSDNAKYFKLILVKSSEVEVDRSYEKCQNFDNEGLTTVISDRIEAKSSYLLKNCLESQYAKKITLAKNMIDNLGDFYPTNYHYGDISLEYGNSNFIRPAVSAGLFEASTSKSVPVCVYFGDLAKIAGYKASHASTYFRYCMSKFLYG